MYHTNIEHNINAIYIHFSYLIWVNKSLVFSVEYYSKKKPEKMHAIYPDKEMAGFSWDGDVPVYQSVCVCVSLEFE